MKVTVAPAIEASSSSTVVEAHFITESEDVADIPLDPICRQLALRARRSSRFTGAVGDVLDIVTPGPAGPAHILIAGIGPTRDDRQALERAGAHVLTAAESCGAERLDLVIGSLRPDIAVAAALGVTSAAYHFLKRGSPEPARTRRTVKSLRLIGTDIPSLQAVWDRQAPVAEAVRFARDQVSEPANVLNPEEFAARLGALRSMGLEVEILDEDALRERGMGALLAVGQGSPRRSQLVTLSWRGGPSGEPPIAFVGKGVCFDSGGLSIKPCDHMADMKWDMAGAAAVAGAMHALAGRKARVNAVGIVGLVENMPDGDAQRPGDVLTSLSGKTIEVIDTDAEGRLVLADLLWHVEDAWKPQAVVDLATLTGAVAIALGDSHGGLFANDERLADQLTAAGVVVDEPLWRLPLAQGLRREIESPIADLKNYGAREGGAISAALFLQEFVRTKRWAHIDMAAMAWREARAPWPAGATGYGVRLLDQFATAYER